MADPALEQPADRTRLLAEAEKAVARGWSLTPLNGKKPKLLKWQKQPKAPLDQVVMWVRNGFNLGLRTGTVSGVVVIDDDSPDGSASLALQLPKTVTVTTGSGKSHFYFRTPQDVRIGNSVKSLADGIDVRGDGGQIVYPGSLHPDTGKPYTWAPGLSPEDIPLADLPEHLLEKLRSKRRGKTKKTEKSEKQKLSLIKGGKAAPTTPSYRDSRIDAYVDAALKGEIDQLLSTTEGGRNDQLNTSAFALGQLIGAGMLDEAKARAELLRAAVQIGLDAAEAEPTIESGISAGRAQPRSMPEPNPSAESHEGPSASTTTQAGPKDTRKVIKLHGGYGHSAADRASRVLRTQTPPLLYLRGSEVVWISRPSSSGASVGASNGPRIVTATTPSIADLLTRLIRWEKLDKRNYEYVPIDCPERIATWILDRREHLRLPVLNGILNAPTIAANHMLVTEDGYHRPSGLYLYKGNVFFPPIPAAPTDAEIVAARDLLLSVLAGFPFIEETDRAVALAAILTAAVRPSLRTAPMFAFRATKMGSGKSLLADVVSMIAAGRPASVMSQGADENEDKKRMLPILSEGEPVAVIDNIERPFASAALCSILTQEMWRDRVLGKSATLQLPTRNTTWLATGNNILFEGDITTRVLVCDLDAKVERPEERKFEVNLHQFVPQHRGRLVVACLTLLHAYHVRGRPKVDLPVFGRFEEWSDKIRQPVVWMDLPDPCLTRRRLEATDPVREDLTQLLSALEEAFSDKPFVASTAATSEHKRLREVLVDVLTRRRGREVTSQSLGLFFHSIAGRIEGGRRLVRIAERGGSAEWRVERV